MHILVVLGLGIFLFLVIVLAIIRFVCALLGIKPGGKEPPSN